MKGTQKPNNRSIPAYLPNWSGEMQKVVSAFDYQLNQFNREHGLFFHPRTHEKLNCVSTLPNKWKVKRSKPTKVYLQKANTLVHQPGNERLNSAIPQTAYHRIINAVVLTRYLLVKGEIIPQSPIHFIKASNTKKFNYSGQRGNYLSVATEKKHQAPRWVKPIEIPKRDYGGMIRKVKPKK